MGSQETRQSMARWNGRSKQLGLLASSAIAAPPGGLAWRCQQHSSILHAIKNAISYNVIYSINPPGSHEIVAPSLDSIAHRQASLQHTRGASEWDK